MSDKVQEIALGENIQYDDEISKEQQQDTDMKQDDQISGQDIPKSEIDQQQQSLSDQIQPEEDFNVGELIQENPTVDNQQQEQISYKDEDIEKNKSSLNYVIPDSVNSQLQAELIKDDDFDDGELIQEEQQQTMNNQPITDIEEIQQHVHEQQIQEIHQQQLDDDFDDGELIQEEQLQTVNNQSISQVTDIQQDVHQQIIQGIHQGQLEDEFDDGELIQVDQQHIQVNQQTSGIGHEDDEISRGEIQENRQVEQDDEFDEGELIQENIQPLENTKTNVDLHQNELKESTAIIVNNQSRKNEDFNDDDEFDEGELIQEYPLENIKSNIDLQQNQLIEGTAIVVNNQPPEDEDFDDGELIEDTIHQPIKQNNHQSNDDFDDGELIQDDDDFDDGELIIEQPKQKPASEDDEFEEGEIIEVKQKDDEFEEGEIVEPIQECSYPLSTQSLQSLTNLFNKFNQIYNPQQEEVKDRQVYEIKPAIIPPIITQLQPTAEQYREQIQNHFQVWFHCSAVQAALSEYGITLDPVNFEFNETQTCDSPFSQRSISDISPLKSQQKSQSELPSMTNQQKFFKTDIENILDLIPDYSHLLSNTIMIK